MPNIQKREKLNSSDIQRTIKEDRRIAQCEIELKAMQIYCHAHDPEWCSEITKLAKDILRLSFRVKSLDDINEQI